MRKKSNRRPLTIMKKKRKHKSLMRKSSSMTGHFMMRMAWLRTTRISILMTMIETSLHKN